MLSTWTQRRAARRLSPGDGRPLQRYRWWQLPGRALFHLEMPGSGGEPVRYAVDLRHWQNQSSGTVRARLYRDGRQHLVSTLPARLPVEGGVIEVAMSTFGVSRCHLVTEDGSERQLEADPRSPEGRRARFEQRHPTASRVIGIVSTLVLLVGVGLLIQQLAVVLTEVPPVAERIGPIDPLLPLTTVQTIGIGLATALASTERALRLRYHPLLDAAGN